MEGLDAQPTKDHVHMVHDSWCLIPDPMQVYKTADRDALLSAIKDAAEAQVSLRFIHRSTWGEERMGATHCACRVLCCALEQHEAAS